MTGTIDEMGVSELFFVSHQIGSPRDLLQTGLPPYSSKGREVLRSHGMALCHAFGCPPARRLELANDFAGWVRNGTIRQFHFSADDVLRQALLVPLQFGEESKAMVLMQLLDGRLLCCEVEGMTLHAGVLRHLAVLWLREGNWERAAKCLMGRLHPEIRIGQSDGALHERQRMRQWLAAWLRRKGLIPAPEEQCPPLEDGAFPASLLNTYAEAAHAALLSFLAQLDRQLRFFALPLSSRSVRRYNYLLGQTSVQRRNRFQAAQALPAIQQLLADWHSPESADQILAAQKYGVLLQAVDSGAPLFACLAELLGVRENVIRSLARQRLALPDTVAMERQVAILSLIPPEHRPRSEQDFSCLACIDLLLPTRQDMRLYLGFRSGKSGDQWPACVALAESRWWPEIARRATRSSWPEVLAWLQEHQGGAVIDLVSALNHAAFLCQFGPTVAFRIFEKSGLFHLLRLAQQWHQTWLRLIRGQDAGETMPQYPDFVPWPALRKQAEWHGGRQIVPLLTADALYEEGERMGHCIGSYIDQAVRGRSFLFSLRDVSGRSCSTLELRVVNGEDHTQAPQVQIIEHRAHRNGKVDAVCQHAAEQFLQSLRLWKPEELPAFWRRLRRCSLRRADDEGLAKQLGRQIGARRRAISARRRAINMIPALRELLAWVVAEAEKCPAYDREIEAAFDAALAIPA